MLLIASYDSSPLLACDASSLCIECGSTCGDERVRTVRVASGTRVGRAQGHTWGKRAKAAGHMPLGPGRAKTTHRVLHLPPGRPVLIALRCCSRPLGNARPCCLLNTAALQLRAASTFDNPCTLLFPFLQASPGCWTRLTPPYRCCCRWPRSRSWRRCWAYRWPPPTA